MVLSEEDLLILVVMSFGLRKSNFKLFHR